MIICSQCGNSVGDDLRYCSECGTEVPLFAGKPGGVPTPAVTVPYVRAPQPTGVQTQPRPPAVVPPAAPAPLAPRGQATMPVALIVIPIGLLVLVGIVVLSVNLTTSNANNTNTTGGLSTDSRSPVPSTPNAIRVVTCRFNGVHVRQSPNLNATIITDIQQGHTIRVIRETSNYDTVKIRSLDQDVTDNWSEVQLENTPVGSVHGWIFSGFLR